MVIRVIKSKDNRIFKDTLSLLRKKERDGRGLYLIEGEKLVAEAVKEGLVKTVITNSDRVCSRDFSQTFPILSEFKDDRIEVVFMVGKLFERLTQTETSQGIIAVVKKYFKKKEEGSYASFLRRVSDSKKPILVLDKLQDPGNIGTLIRTAEATGFAGVISVKGTGDFYSPKAVRSAAGSTMRVPLLESENYRALLDIIKKTGRILVSTSPEAKEMYFETEDDVNTAIVIGNEGGGVSDFLLSASVYCVKLPMAGRVESLNAAVCGAVIMYHSYMKRNLV